MTAGEVCQRLTRPTRLSWFPAERPQDTPSVARGAQRLRAGVLTYARDYGRYGRRLLRSAMMFE